MKALIKEKNFILEKIIYILILILPITLIAGSLLVNITIVLIDLLFVINLFLKRNNYILLDNNFRFLLIIYLYLIINSVFISPNPDSILKSFGFIRFFILAYALNFYFHTYREQILKFWAIIFLIVTFDIAYEFIFKKNILGFTSTDPRRIASFTNDELKIGGFYFGFVSLILFYFKKKKFFLFSLFFVLFFIIAFLIGERSNFLKIFFIYIVFFIISKKFTIKQIALYFCLLLMLISIFAINNRLYLNKYLYIINIVNIIFDKKNTDQIFLERLIQNNRHFGHYQIATQIFKDKPLFGSGFKSFRIESFKEKYYINNIKYGSTHPHQFHFEILSELGIVGYLLIMINISLLIFRRWDKNDPYKVGSTIFIIASLIPILPSGSFFTTYGATLFFLNYSFLLSQKKINNK